MKGKEAMQKWKYLEWVTNQGWIIAEAEDIQSLAVSMNRGLLTKGLKGVKLRDATTIEIQSGVNRLTVMNALGAEGWELTGITGDTRFPNLYFKRGER